MPDLVKLNRSWESLTSTSDLNHLFWQKDLLKLYHFTQDVGISHHPQPIMVNLTDGKECLCCGGRKGASALRADTQVIYSSAAIQSWKHACICRTKHLVTPVLPQVSPF